MFHQQINRIRDGKWLPDTRLLRVSSAVFQTRWDVRAGARSRAGNGLHDEAVKKRNCSCNAPWNPLGQQRTNCVVAENSGAASLGREPRDCVRCCVDEGIDCYVKNVLA